MVNEWNEWHNDDMRDDVLLDRPAPVRISVSGAHGVGKTTFCSDVADALKAGGRTVEIKTDVARSLKGEGVPINQSTEDAQYALFFERHLDNLFAPPQTDVVLYDRTILDSIAYAIANKNLDSRWLSFAKKAAAHLLEGIDLYFYIPIEFAIEDDGVRATGAEYQNRVDQALVALFKESQLHVITIVGNRAERVEYATKIISAQ